MAKEEKKQQTGIQFAPVAKQWEDLKQKHPDALLMFRNGDFYELYKQDAEAASKALDITLKHQGGKDGIAMAGFPYHALDTYLPKLIGAGHRVAICDAIQEKQKVMEEVTPSKVEKKASKGKRTSQKGSSAKSAEDKALDVFADMMIEKIQTISQDWKKPWFTDGAMAWPKNLSGREYNGMNSLMLMMHAEKEGYKIPVYATFATLQRLNQAVEEKATKKGEEAPRVMVNRGAAAFPVILTTFTVIDKETKEKIPYDDYKKLQEDEKEKYKVYPSTHVYHVFNVAQTNMQEVRPDLWQKLENENTVKLPEAKGEQFTFEPVEKMIKDNLWICPIKPLHQDKAYFSLSANEIVVPEKQQFKDGESFYGTLFHEMTHSTGQEGVLDRIKPAAFGSDGYAREELVAELGAALVAQRYGMSKNLKEESAAYLKSWLGSLKESPEFIKTTLVDVKKATAIITRNIDGIAEKIENEKSADRVAEKEQATEVKDEKELALKIENSQAMKAPKVEKNFAKEEVTKEVKASADAKPENKREEEMAGKQRREPQLVTVNGDKVSHAHAFQHEKNPEIWLFTARINGTPLHPMVMTKEDVAAYQAKETTVKGLMERYYPTKMQKQLSPEEYKVGMTLSDGQKVEKFRVFKENDKEHDDFGKWKGYAEVGGKKMVAVMSTRDLDAYFDRTQTPAQIVERTFGEKLHLASAYKEYKLPDGVKEENVRISKDGDGKWKVSVDLGDKGTTPKKPLSFDDGLSFFRTKTATREQLAAKYLTSEIHTMLSQKQEVKKGMKR